MWNGKRNRGITRKKNQHLIKTTEKLYLAFEDSYRLWACRSLLADSVTEAIMGWPHGPWRTRQEAGPPQGFMIVNHRLGKDRSSLIM